MEVVNMKALTKVRQCKHSLSMGQPVPTHFFDVLCWVQFDMAHTAIYFELCCTLPTLDCSVNGILAKETW